MSGFELKITDTSGNELKNFLGDIIKDADMVGDDILKEAAKIIKVRVEGNLRNLQKKRYNKSGYELKRPREIHMADDVTIKFSNDKHGYRVAKIVGGKYTGTLWHIVNNGTYLAKATHFMDKSINQSDIQIESALDNKMKEVF